VHDGAKPKRCPRKMHERSESIGYLSIMFGSQSQRNPRSKPNTKCKIEKSHYPIPPNILISIRSPQSLTSVHPRVRPQHQHPMTKAIKDTTCLNSSSPSRLLSTHALVSMGMRLADITQASRMRNVCHRFLSLMQDFWIM